MIIRAEISLDSGDPACKGSGFRRFRALGGFRGFWGV